MYKPILKIELETIPQKTLNQNLFLPIASLNNSEIIIISQIKKLNKKSSSIIFDDVFIVMIYFNRI